MSHSRVSGWLLLPAAALVFLQPLAAVAQQAGARPDEIRVTARKREESLQSVPIAVSAFSSEDLAIRDIFSLEQLADQTPGLTFATTGAITGTRAVIRGLAQQTRVGDETNVATFIDGVYTPGFSGAEFFGFDSLERVEVVKGPQSALYGRNSFAGAINYVSKRPTYEFEYGGRLEVGQGERQGLTAYVAGPLVQDKLALRVDGGYNRTGGTNINTADNEPLGSTDTQFARATFVADPLDNLRLFLRLSAQDDFANPLAETLIADDDPNRVGLRLSVSPFELGAGGGQRIGRLYRGEINNRSNNYTIDPRSFSGDREIRRASFEFDWDLGWASLIGITGYQDRQVSTLNDFNTCRNDVRPAVCDTVSPTAIGTFFGGTAGGNPLLLGGNQIVSVLTGTVEDRDEFSQNLYLQSNGDGDFQWLAGVYYSTEDFKDQNQRLSDALIQNPAGTIIYAIASPVPQTDSTTLISNQFYSVFASGSLDFNATWNLTVEGRYTREDKEANQIADLYPIRTPPSQPTGLQQRAFNFFTPRFILTATPTADFLAYVSAAKGVKSGGFNPGSVQFPTFDQEENWTYEIGSKWTLWDGRARVNTAAYFVDWDQQQITATDPDNTQLPIT
ncbi:MAG: TonB-dependent receptor, partial [Gammaproteobacteria bacterium]|nr:TonB-dependent receptor [Gammaproteobacteria bacterium]